MPGLQIMTSIELPPSGVWQEVQLQIVGCLQCDFHGVAVYRESRAGRLDSEIVHHYAYALPDSVVENIRKSIVSCESRRDRCCGCDAHTELAARYRPGQQTEFAGLEGAESRLWLRWARD